ncbi:MAG: winged helix-turn-helix domain-containing protein [Methanotrichaceae archaeon]
MKRSRHTIISQVLNICIGGASKTKIVYQANLNFRTVNPYIELLTKNGLINIKNGSTVIYETTEKGKALLDSIRQVQNELSKT